MELGSREGRGQGGSREETARPSWVGERESSGRARLGPPLWVGERVLGSRADKAPSSAPGATQVSYVELKCCSDDTLRLLARLCNDLCPGGCAVLVLVQGGDLHDTEGRGSSDTRFVRPESQPESRPSRKRVRQITRSPIFAEILHTMELDPDCPKAHSRSLFST